MDDLCVVGRRVAAPSSGSAAASASSTPAFVSRLDLSNASSSAAACAASAATAAAPATSAAAAVHELQVGAGSARLQAAPMPREVAELDALLRRQKEIALALLALEKDSISIEAATPRQQWSGDERARNSAIETRAAALCKESADIGARLERIDAFVFDLHDAIVRYNVALAAFSAAEAEHMQLVASAPDGEAADEAFVEHEEAMAERVAALQPELEDAWAALCELLGGDDDAAAAAAPPQSL